MIPIAQRAADQFQARMGAPPERVVAAPGRVNLIGDHTDYNDGFVMPLAIDRWLAIALSPRSDGEVHLYSMDYDDARSFTPSALEPAEHSWLEYVKAIAWGFAQHGTQVGGFDGVMSGNVPLGSGLSSSAALELAVARAFAELGELPWDPTKMALLAQEAEHGWLNVKCGIMDQLISARGVEDHALLIDCRDLSTRAVPLPAGTSVMVMDTKTPRGLVDSAYNERREQCEAGAAAFGKKVLRDVSLADFEAGAAELSELSRRRVRHVITENDRVLRAAEAMAGGDAETLGRLMNESHASLRDDFEVSCEALDVMSEAARGAPGCYGARMSGAGFGGACVALVKQEAVEAFTATVERQFTDRMHRTPSIFACRAVVGAGVETRAA